MATRVIDDTKLQNIAVAIQGKDSGGTMTVDEMPTRIAAIPTGDEVLFSSSGRQYTRTVEMPDGVTTLARFAFHGCTKLTEIDLKNVTKIEKEVFSYCTGLTEIDLKNVTTFLNDYHFMHCSSLRKVIGKKVTSTLYSFYDCTVLETAILSNVSTIGKNTFYNAYVLKNVDCRNADMIVDGSFQNCSRLSLIDLTSRTTPTTLTNTSAFTGTNSTWIAVVANDTIKSDFQNATNWSTFASHFRTIAEVEAEVGMTYDEYYLQIFGHARNEVSA